ncbi:MAG: magnesium/cobalt transporter CorA [Methylophilaceae bacterium]
MRRQKRHHNKKIGLPPGALVYIGDAEINHFDAPKISKIVYDANGLVECELQVHELAAFKVDPNKKIWLNVHGVHDAKLVKLVCDLFNLHPLVIEDILNTEQRPKLDEYDDYIFLETRHFHYDTTNMTANSEQISMVIGHNFLLTFQERATGAFEPVRERLRASKAQIRTLGVDYLAYALLDSIVDRYFKVLEDVSEASENLEGRILARPGNTDLQNIHQLKHVSIELRRAVWPLREVINALIRNDKNFFKPSTLPYLRDVYDHTISFIESLESIRDSLISMMDIYMASMSQRVNLELRALTVVTMLFMPATLITGVFGMNFENMPWLKHKDGFYWALGLMFSIATVMLLIFWRRQWVTKSIFASDQSK